MNTADTTTHTSRPRQSKFRENLFPVVLLASACVGIFAIVDLLFKTVAAMVAFYARLAAGGECGFQTPAELFGFTCIAMAVGAAIDHLLIHLATRE